MAGKQKLGRLLYALLDNLAMIIYILIGLAILGVIYVFYSAVTGEVWATKLICGNSAEFVPSMISCVWHT